MTKEELLVAIDAQAVEAVRTAASSEEHPLLLVETALFKEADYHVDHVWQGLPDHLYS